MKNVHEIEVKLEKEWVEACDKAYKKISKDVAIDGFRKGSVPKNMFIQKYGMMDIYEEALHMVMDGNFEKVIKDSKLVPVVRPSVDMSDVSDESVTLKYIVITKPEFKLGEYKKLNVKKDKVSISAKEVDAKIKELQETMVEHTVKTKGAIANGDTAVIDFEGSMDGVVFDGGTGSDYPLEIGSNSFIPGFEEKLVGAKLGEERSIDLKFPDEYVDHLKGKDVTFKVVVKEIKEKVMPELNQDFYDDLGLEKIKSEEEFKKHIKDELSKEAEAETDNKFIDDCLVEVIKNTNLELNEEIIDDEIDRMVEEYDKKMMMQGMDLEKMFEMTGMSMEKLRDDLKLEATKRVECRYILEEISNVEKLDFTDKEVKENGKKMAENYGVTYEELIEAFGSVEIIKYDMKMHRALEIIKENN